MSISAASQIFAKCLLVAAQTYNVPPAVLMGIHYVEGGKVGMQTGPNVNGTYDLGPMQVNTIWLPKLMREWRVDRRTAHAWVRDDVCTNVGVAGWILRQKINEEGGSLARGIAAYHSKTAWRGKAYLKKVLLSMSRHGLIQFETRKTVPVIPAKRLEVSER
ncbi:MAG: transglycosylase [Alphaproteobacteria bacterium GWF2_58_20]|nr:MAG: transglycosylase [Alphaproteobacteria bacterium GWF2_58_20]